MSRSHQSRSSPAASANDSSKATARSVSAWQARLQVGAKPSVAPTRVDSMSVCVSS